MRKLVFLLLIGLLSSRGSAQTCLHTDLSKKFNYRVTMRSLKIDTDYGDAINSKITIEVIDKTSKTRVQKISLTAQFLSSDDFRKCNNVRSYITGKNKNLDVADCEFGDIVIADLNFDGREDIAVKSHESVDAGPTYTFYVQDDAGHFILDHYLTTQMVFFPEFIHPMSKTLITQVHANVNQRAKKSFQYNPITKKWKLIKWVMVD